MSPARDVRSVNFCLAPKPAHGLDLLLVGISLLEFAYIHLFGHTDLLIICYHLFLLVMKEVVHPADNSKADNKTDQETFPLEQYCQEHSEDDPADTDTYDPVSELLSIKSLRRFDAFRIHLLSVQVLLIAGRRSVVIHVARHS